MKKLLYSLFITLCSVVLLAGCQKTDPADVTEYTVTFNGNNGSESQTVTAKEGQKLAKPTDPTNGELIFAGWYKESTWVTPWDFEKDVVTKDITLYAKWTTVSFTVTFNTNGGSTIAPVTVAKGSKLVQPLPPSKQDMAFENWYTEAALTTVYDFSTPVNSDITLYAKWATITQEALQTLINEADRIISSNYTTESYNNLRLKLENARTVASNQSATQAEIAAAYNVLQTAINELVKVENRAAVAIEVDNIIDGVIFVSPGTLTTIYARAIDKDHDFATNKRVTFTYDQAALATWVDGEITATDNALNFRAKGSITAGATITLTIKSDENPAISTTVTLKAAGQEELKTMYLNLVNSLPSPDKISYEHYDTLDKALALYNSLPNDDRNAQAVVTAQKKLTACMDAYWDLPEKMKFSFKGNVCTLTNIQGSESEEIGELTYVANGAFPAGTYTQITWIKYDESDQYFYQSRLTLKSDGTGISEERRATDANGTNASAWGDGTGLTYTYQGTQTAGGFFFIDFQDEEEEPRPNFIIGRR